MIRNISSKLGSIETTLLLSNQYDIHYGLNRNTEEDNIFGPTLFREEEYIGNTNRLNNLLDTFTNLKINKLYNMSLKDFLNLSKADILVLIDHAKNTLDRQEEDLDEIINENS